MKKTIFVTGTDTGVGKTVLTALLLAFLRRDGDAALGIKPFCSGSRGDARLLHSLQEEGLTLDEVNPFYFDKPLAPAAAGKGLQVPLRDVVKHIRRIESRCDLLLVEGAGGLLAPLGENYSAREIICRLDCKIVVVSPNRLGAINHVLLTVSSLQAAGIEDITVVLMGVRKPDLSAGSNAAMVGQRLKEKAVYCLPYMGIYASKSPQIKNNVKFLQKTLAHIVGHDMLIAFFRNKEG